MPTRPGATAALARFAMSRVISSAAELGVARHDRQFLDVDRGVAVFGNDAFEIRIESSKL
jgi:hypothetical protein